MFFIVSISALDVHIYSPYEKPTLDNVSNSSGGGWSAGDYNISVVSSNKPRNYAYLIRSPISNVKEITLAENDKLIVNYTIPNEAEAPSYLFVFYQDGGQWKFATMNTALSSYPDGLIIDSPYETTFHRWTILDNFNLLDEGYWGLNTSKGVGQIYVSGSSGQLEMNAIVDILKTSGNLTQGEDYILAGDGSIISTASFYIDATGGTIDIGGYYLSFYGGIYATSGVIVSANSISTGTLTYILSPQRGGYLNPVTIQNLQGKNIVLGTAFKDSSEAHASYGHSCSISGSINRSLVSTWFSTVSSDMGEKSIYNSLTDGRFWDDDYHDISTFQTRIYVRSNKGDIYDSSLYSTSSEEIFWLPNHESGVNFYDVDIYENGVLQSYPEIDYYDLNSYERNTTIKFYNTLKITVLNETEHLLSDANILVRNGYGELVLNKTTSANGTIEEYIKVLEHWNFNNEGPCSNCGNETDFSPFTITITKDNYETYNMTLNISGKQDWTIALSPPSSGETEPLNTTHFQIGSSLKLNYVSSLIIPFIQNLRNSILLVFVNIPLIRIW